MISNVSVTEVPDEGGWLVTARFEMLEFRPRLEQRSFGGKYEYELRRDADGAFRIVSKKAVIINCDAVHLPVAVPF